MNEPLELDSIYYGDESKDISLEWLEREGVPVEVAHVRVADIELEVRLNLREPYLHSKIGMVALIAEVRRLRYALYRANGGYELIDPTSLPDDE